MTTNATPAAGQPQIMDEDRAFATLYQTVYTPAFFRKLAFDYGFKPRDDNEALRALKLAAQLRVAYDSEQEKVAASKGSVLDRMETGINTMLKRAGHNVPQVLDTQLKNAAARASFDPALASAILSLHAAGNAA